LGKVSVDFNVFLNSVDPKYHDFVMQANDFMQQNDCKLKLELAKNGYVASYQHGKKKRVILNFVFRKSGLFSRIYTNNIGRYMEVLEKIPEKISKSIEKAPVCKRFNDPSECNPKCNGYLFTMNDTQYQKCRYNCFLFAVDDESIPIIKSLYEKELKCRNLANDE